MNKSKEVVEARLKCRDKILEVMDALDELNNMLNNVGDEKELNILMKYSDATLMLAWFWKEERCLEVEE